MNKRQRKKRIKTELGTVNVSLADVYNDPIDAAQRASAIIAAAYQCDESLRTRVIIQLEVGRLSNLVNLAL
ncbi:hypothetical protein FQS87_19150 [Enterococcus avium]|uniref:hypothetical protein n=1 Tax=Enterococcus avium TaxID=33945 RepID=UPI001A95651C|nr:hypothetical protein [Enterococcus avium]MBO1142017.1 hypothetical protein [Enterococcus avium]